MKKIVMLLPLLQIMLCNCTTKEHQLTQRDIAKHHYRALETPIAVTECNGVKTTIYRQSMPQYEQKDEPTVATVKQAGAVLTSPVGIIGGGALLLSQVEGNTTDSNNETTVNTTTEMIIPEEEE
jgi:hypothetical protein